MLLTEYNETQTMELFKEEGREEGRAEGRAVGRAEGRIEGRAEGRAVGRVEGRAEGETKLGILINKLMAAGRIGDIEKAATDPISRDHLYAEFGMV